MFVGINRVISFILLMSVLVMMGCKHDDGDTPPNVDGSGGDTQQIPQTVNITVEIDVPQSLANTQLKILTGDQKQDYTGVGSALIVQDSPIIVTALDSEDRLIYMSMSSGVEGENVVLDATSTAISLLMLNPMIGALSEDQIRAFLPILKALPEVSTLAAEIGNSISAMKPGDASWTEGFSPALQQVVASVSIAAVNAFEANNILAITAQTGAEQVLGIVKTEPIAAGDDKSGLSVDIHQDKVNRDKFKIDIRNSYDRWVRAYLKLDNGTEISVDIGPNKSDVTDNFTNLVGDDVLGSKDKPAVTALYIFGPGLGAIPPSFDSNLLLRPTIFTFLSRYAVPIVEKVIGKNECIATLLSPSGAIATEVLVKLAEQTNLASLSNDKIIDLVFEIARDSLAKIGELSGPVCQLTDLLKEAAKEHAKKISPILGQIKLAIDVTSLAYDIYFDDVLNSNPIEAFYLINDANVNLLAMTSTQAVEQGGFTDGTCPANSKCERFVWDESRNPDGLNVDFRLQCDGGCVSSSWSIEQNTLPDALPDSDGVIRVSYNFKNEGIFPVNITVTDNHNAQIVYGFFQVQIKKAIPQISLQYSKDFIPLMNNGAINFSVNSVLETDYFLTTVSNTGNGDLVISNLAIDNLTNFNFSTLGALPYVTYPNKITITPGESFIFFPIYSPSVTTQVETTLRIDSNSKVDPNIVVNLRGSTGIDCTIYNNLVLGAWQVVFTNNYGNPTNVYDMEVFTNGAAQYTTEDGTTFGASWSISKGQGLDEVGCMFYDKGFWHFAYDSLPRTILTDPVTSFYVEGKYPAAEGYVIDDGSNFLIDLVTYTKQ